MNIMQFILKPKTRDYLGLDILALVWQQNIIIIIIILMSAAWLNNECAIQYWPSAVAERPRQFGRECQEQAVRFGH